MPITKTKHVQLLICDLKLLILVYTCIRFLLIHRRRRRPKDVENFGIKISTVGIQEILLYINYNQFSGLISVHETPQFGYLFKIIARVLPLL